MNDAIETWSISNRINLYLLDAVADEALGCKLGGKGRSVAEQFAHLHNVRLMWLKAAEPALLKGLAKVEKEGDLGKGTLREALEKSGTAIEALLRSGFTSGKIKGFKPHPAAFLGYMVAHEAHHRGQIALTLKHEGYPLDKKAGFGMWEWGSR